MDFKSNYKNIGMGISIPTEVVGGTPPYVYSIAPDGAGGSIDAEGVYKAPYNIGIDEVTVEDSLGETAILVINVQTAIQLLGNILRNYLNLAEDQVYLMNQKIKPVDDNRLMIALSTLSPKAMGVTKEYEGDDQKISSLLMCPVDITIYSKTLEAFLRKEEVIHALISDYSKRQQELNSFSIGRLPNSFVTLNNVEGSSIPYMYNLTFNIQYVSTSVRSTEFFDQFERQVLTED